MFGLGYSSVVGWEASWGIEREEEGGGGGGGERIDGKGHDEKKKVTCVVSGDM